MFDRKEPTDLYFITYVDPREKETSLRYQCRYTDSEGGAISTVDSLASSGCVNITVTNYSSYRRNLTLTGCPWRLVTKTFDGEYVYHAVFNPEGGKYD